MIGNVKPFQPPSHPKAGILLGHGHHVSHAAPAAVHAAVHASVPCCGAIALQVCAGLQQFIRDSMELHTTSFNILAWDEDRTSQKTPRVTPAHVTFALPEMEGEVKAEYLMTYLPNGDAQFIFTDTVTAKNLNGKSGSFITQGKGTFKAASHSVEGFFTVVDGTGTSALASVSGEGKFASSPNSVYEFRLAA